MKETASFIFIEGKERTAKTLRQRLFSRNKLFGCLTGMLTETSVER